MSIFICNVCGHIEFKSVPDNCPVCFAPKEKFSQNDDVFEEAEKKSMEAAIKHVPAVKVNKKCSLIPEQSCVDAIVRIGETLHPMEDKHFINWIDCYVDDDYISRIFLTPGVFAAGCFHLKKTGAMLRIVEMCNIHGHWQTEANIG